MALADRCRNPVVTSCCLSLTRVQLRPRFLAVDQARLDPILLHPRYLHVPRGQDEDFHLPEPTRRNYSTPTVEEGPVTKMFV